MFGDHGLCGLLEEGAHEKSPKCLGGNLGDLGGILQKSQFVIHLDNGLFNEAVLFDRTNLLIDFPLGRCDTVIDFGQINGVVYTSEFKNEREVEFSPLKNQEKQELLNLFANQRPLQ